MFTDNQEIEGLRFAINESDGEQIRHLTSASMQWGTAEIGYPKGTAWLLRWPCGSFWENPTTGTRLRTFFWRSDSTLSDQQREGCNEQRNLASSVFSRLVGELFNVR